MNKDKKKTIYLGNKILLRSGLTFGLGTEPEAEENATTPHRPRPTAHGPLSETPCACWHHPSSTPRKLSRWSTSAVAHHDDSVLDVVILGGAWRGSSAAPSTRGGATRHGDICFDQFTHLQVSATRSFADRRAKYEIECSHASAQGCTRKRGRDSPQADCPGHNQMPRTRDRIGPRSY